VILLGGEMQAGLRVVARGPHERGVLGERREHGVRIAQSSGCDEGGFFAHRGENVRCGTGGG
jgi:hypothetical protein